MLTELGKPRAQPRRAAIHYWGLAILVIGLASAALIYAFAGDDADAEAAREIASERMYQHNIALMGGQFAVLSDEFNRWFGSLWHGRALACTVAVLAVAIAAACFWIGGLMSVPSSDGEDPKVDG
ncbi:MAG TPA: hypothetical protein VL742_12115 [Casimicrobiaceae bacterium]|nr:hypothetical protein [Casimicrobiaceae bacterium]